MTVSVDAAWNNAVEQIKGSAHQPSAAFHWNPGSLRGAVTARVPAVSELSDDLDAVRPMTASHPVSGETPKPSAATKSRTACEPRLAGSRM
jgi:hypothetical protein